MTMPPVLIVEDEAKRAALLVDYLRAVLLDVMLPGQDGMAVCRELRGFSQVPIIMLTARVAEVDRLLGLELGADDYLCKPYSPREVVARVKAQLRRSAWAAPAPRAPASALSLDTATLRALVDGAPLDLTPTEFRLLRVLAEQPGRVFSRDQLLDRLHDDGRAVTDRVVDSHIRNLRRKLEAVPGGVNPVRSVYGVGYAFEWPEA
jgi:two-component system response regulator BaeR